MIDRRTARERSATARRVIQGDSADDRVRTSDLIRAQRPPAAPWTVFVDVDESQPQQRRRATPRESRVRRRPTEWEVVEDKSESNKENVGYEVRRPKRARRSLEPAHVHADGDETKTMTPTTTETPRQAAAPSTPVTPAAPQNKGKRKLKTPTPPKAENAKKPKKSEQVMKTEQVTRAETEPERPAQRVRRPLEDITHLFIDPTAHYFRPWRRAAAFASVRAATMRIL